MAKILVRADDLGYSEAFNYGLARAVKSGIVGGRQTKTVFWVHAIFLILCPFGNMTGSQNFLHGESS